MSGTEIPNHRAKMATRVPKGIAADDPSTQSIRFIRKKSAKTILWYETGRHKTHQTVNGQDIKPYVESCAIPGKHKQ